MDHVQLPPDAGRVAGINERLRELATESDDNVTDQHVVSQVILRRFARRVERRQGRQLSWMNLEYPAAKPKFSGPAGCGVAPHFVRYASRSAERIWAVIEDRLPPALQACDNGTLFDHPKHVNTIKEAIALHFVRSYQTLGVHERAWAETRDEHRSAWLNMPGFLDRAHYARTGLYAAGVEALEATADDLLAPVEALVRSGAMFRARIEDVFKMALEKAKAACLEIGKPGNGEFLIGDTPALAIRYDRPGVRPLDGIAMGDANAVLLPLGPRRLASLGKVDMYGTIPKEWVDAFNTLQVRAAHKHVYFRPGSGLEEFVRRAVNVRSQRRP